ncbi:histidine kinase, partial [Candidatus Acetothermia bacterium]
MQRTSAYSENSRETDEGWRAIVEASPVGIYLVQNHKFVYVNRALAEMLGYRREEFVGRLGPLDVVHPEDRDLVARMMRERLS